MSFMEFKEFEKMIDGKKKQQQKKTTTTHRMVTTDTRLHCND